MIFFDFSKRTHNTRNSDICYWNKMKNKKYHTLGTVSLSNRQIVEWDRIDIPNTHILDSPLSCLDTGSEVFSLTFLITAVKNTDDHIYSMTPYVFFRFLSCYYSAVDHTIFLSLTKKLYVHWLHDLISSHSSASTVSLNVGYSKLISGSLRIGR